MKSTLSLCVWLLGSVISMRAAQAAAPAAAQTTNTAPAGAKEQAEPESRLKRAPNGEMVVTLDAATQKLIGLQTSPVQPAELKPELKAYGRVLEFSGLATLAADLTSAQATSEASRTQLERLKTLAAQNNASQQTLEAAQAAAVRDQTQVESARLRLLATWGSTLAQRNDLTAFIQSLASLSNALVELDLPAGQTLQDQPTGARLMTLSSNSPPVPAQFLGPAPLVDPQLQGHGFLFLVSPNPSRLTPGAAVSGFIELPGEPQHGLLLPRDAVLRFNGTTWVYLQTGDNTFQRHEVSLQAPLANGWFVREGLKPGDKVVTAAGQQLLSEELKGQGGEE